MVVSYNSKFVDCNVTIFKHEIFNCNSESEYEKICRFPISASSDCTIREQGVSVCKELLRLEQIGLNRPIKRNGKPRVFCKPRINERAKTILELPIYNTDIDDNDDIRRESSFKSYEKFGLCFRTNCGKFLFREW